MEVIFEITSMGITRYGGNYQHFVEQKEIQLLALQRQLLDAEKAVRKAENSVQDSREKHEQRRAKGSKEAKQGKIDKLTADFRKGHSEKTQSRLLTQEERLISEASKTISAVKEKIEIKYDIQADLKSTAVPNGKVVLQIDNLWFKYQDQEKYLFKEFDLQMIGPERIALLGNNGVGKTTLINLILKKLFPAIGKVNLNVNYISYLDQQVSILNPQELLIDNFNRLNPQLTLNQAHHALAQFKFRNKDAQKRVMHLSGGERIRAGLACVLMSQHPPQLLILDEPTNHLDIRSIQSIEEILAKYQGALIVISHDREFLKKVDIQKEIDLMN
jgi:ATPase subunit of ABC transporter with duplicated ATPase domains